MGEDLIKKVVEIEVKEISDRVLEFVGSTEKQDRDGEVIRAEGWDLKNYKKNPVFMWAHDYRQPPIGKALSAKVTDNKLTFKIEFADADTYEFADTIYKLYKGGFLKATSVGFIPREWEDGDGEKAPRRTYKKQELLELSGVPVPSNPDAVLTPAREAEIITVKEYNACVGEWCNITREWPNATTDSPNYTGEGIVIESDIPITKPEETDDWIRIPIRECDVTATIDISKKEGIKALYCGKEKQVKTYMFDKREPYNWTMARAKKWVEDHKQVIYQCECIECGHKLESEKHCRDIKCPKCGGGMRRIERPGPGKELPQEKEVSQAEIRDEFDYVKVLIEKEGMNEEVTNIAWDLVREVMRLTGSDIPDDILAKVGAVLSAKNKSNLKEAQRLIQSVLDNAESEHESVSEPETKPTAEEITEAVKLAMAK